MLKIEFSAQWMTQMTPRIMNLSSESPNMVSPSRHGLLNAANNPTAGVHAARFYLMKGTVPTSFTELPNLNARIADALCLFSSGASGQHGDFAGTQENANPVTVSTIYKAAIASGEVTWFWWTVVPNLVSGLPNLAATLAHNAYGSVGLIGSGSDLEMPSTTLVAGQSYRVRNLRLLFPASWEY